MRSDKLRRRVGRALAVPTTEGLRSADDHTPAASSAQDSEAHSAPPIPATPRRSTGGQPQAASPAGARSGSAFPSNLADQLGPLARAARAFPRLVLSLRASSPAFAAAWDVAASSPSAALRLAFDRALPAAPSRSGMRRSGRRINARGATVCECLWPGSIRAASAPWSR